MAESALESAVALGLRGLALPPHQREFAFEPGRRWRFDFAWPAHKVALEVDGGLYRAGAHSRGASIERDHEKRNTAAMRGWRVLVIGPKAVQSGAWVAFLEGALGLDIKDPKR